MPNSNNDSSVAYDVIIDPASLHLQVRMTLSGALFNGEVPLVLPSWVPGDYDFEPYGRDVFQLNATDGEGNRLSVKRTGYNGYTIQSTSDRLIVIYNASAYEPDLGDAMGLVDSQYAVLVGTRYLFCPDYLGPCQVNYQSLPDGWKFHHPSGATQVGDGPSWIYPSYELLLDTPVVFGHFTLLQKTIADKPFYFVFVDQGVGFKQQVQAFVDQLSVAVDKLYQVFSEFPFSDYTFVLSLNPQADWGLEHLTSNMSGLGPEVFVDPDQFSNGIRVCVHELFHAWNVRRLRPSPLGQLSHQLARGCFSEGLWMAEGFTRYYEFLISTRAQAYTPQQFFSAIANYYQHLCQQPAYKRVSATDSSFATYMNHMKYPGRVNNGIDYYDKGMLIAFGIDALLRSTTNDTLDQVFSAFYQTYFGSGSTVPPDYVGYTTQDVVSFFNERHQGLGDSIQSQVDDPALLDTPAQFEQIGLTPVWQASYYLGLFFMNSDEPTIYGVSDISAAGAVGIAPADMITSINGYAFNAKSLKWAASQADTVTLGIRRGHRELSFDLTPRPIRRLSALTWHGTESQARAIADWLDAGDFSPSRGESIGLDFYENFHGIETLI